MVEHVAMKTLTGAERRFSTLYLPGELKVGKVKQSGIGNVGQWQSTKGKKNRETDEPA